MEQEQEESARKRRNFALYAIGAIYDWCDTFWIARANASLDAHFSLRHADVITTHRVAAPRGMDPKRMTLVVSRLFVFAHFHFRKKPPRSWHRRPGAINYRGDNGRERSPWISLITTHVTEFARNIGISRKSGLLRKSERERERTVTKIHNTRNTSCLETILIVSIR